MTTMEKKVKRTKLTQIPLNRILALVLMDIMSVLVAAFGALFIRFEFSFNAIDKTYLERFEHIIIPDILMALLFFVLWKLYKSVWRYASANELINIVFATSCTAAAQVICCLTTGNNMPRS